MPRFKQVGGKGRIFTQILHLLWLTFFRERIPSLVSLSVDMENTPEPSPFIIVYFMSAFEPVSASFALILPTADPT